MNTARPQTGYLRQKKSHLELVEDFRCFDRNADGKIDYEEFKDFMDLLDAQLTEKESLVGFREIDQDRDGLIGVPDFLTWWRAQ